MVAPLQSLRTIHDDDEEEAEIQDTKKRKQKYKTTKKKKQMRLTKRKEVRNGTRCVVGAVCCERAREGERVLSERVSRVLVRARGREREPRARERVSRERVSRERVSRERESFQREAMGVAGDDVLSCVFLLRLAFVNKVRHTTRTALLGKL